MVLRDLSSRGIAERRISKVRSDYDVEGLDEVIYELGNLKGLGYYEKFYSSYQKWKDPSIMGDGLSDDEKKNNKLIMLPHEILGRYPIKLPYISDTIDYLDFSFFFPFLELIYSMSLGRELVVDDVRRLVGSGFGERVIFDLEKFDDVSDVQEATPEFFVKLKNVGWRDRKSKSLLSKLNEIREFEKFDILGYLHGLEFQNKEDMFILSLAGCSAVNDERDKIIEFDVVRAYRTYFKLIRTDITRFIDDNVSTLGPENTSGYLICDKCYEYYKLQPGESPENFTDKCECGGHLRFVKNL